MGYPLAKPQVGIVHEYDENLTAFEFTKSEEYSPNVVLFIAGLTNGLMNVPYLPPLGERISSIETKVGKWVLIQALITSSYIGWGVSSLKNDVNDISKIIKYLRSPIGGNRKKIILVGHSTGCQDTMEYISKFSYQSDFDISLAVDGGVLQAPVSDREAMLMGDGNKLDSYLQEIHDNYIIKRKGEHLLPEKFRQMMFGSPITAYRFYSLALERGDDDYFSSYLNENDHKNSFGKINKPLLVLYGSKDECVPNHVDREKLINNWQKATDPKYWSPFSKVLQGATHNVGPGSDEGAMEDLIDTIIKFIKSI